MKYGQTFAAGYGNPDNWVQGQRAFNSGSAYRCYFTPPSGDNAYWHLYADNQLADGVATMSGLVSGEAGPVRVQCGRSRNGPTGPAICWLRIGHAPDDTLDLSAIARDYDSVGATQARLAWEWPYSLACDDDVGRVASGWALSMPYNTTDAGAQPNWRTQRYEVSTTSGLTSGSIHTVRIRWLATVLAEGSLYALSGGNVYLRDDGYANWQNSFAALPTDAARADAYALGYYFTVPAAVRVERLGRLYVAGNTQDHAVKIWNKATHALLAAGTVLAASASDAGGFKWVEISPLTLQPGTTYVLSVDESGPDTWKDAWGPNLQPTISLGGYAYGTVGQYPANQGAGSAIYSTPAMWLSDMFVSGSQLSGSGVSGSCYIRPVSGLYSGAVQVRYARSMRIGKSSVLSGAVTWLASGANEVFHGGQDGSYVTASGAASGTWYWWLASVDDSLAASAPAYAGTTTIAPMPESPTNLHVISGATSGAVSGVTFAFSGSIVSGTTDYYEHGMIVSGVLSGYWYVVGVPAPDGTTSGTRIMEEEAAQQRLWRLTPTTPLSAGGSYEFSVWVRKPSPPLSGLANITLWIGSGVSGTPLAWAQYYTYSGTLMESVDTGERINYVAVVTSGSVGAYSTASGWAYLRMGFTGVSGATPLYVADDEAPPIAQTPGVSGCGWDMWYPRLQPDPHQYRLYASPVGGGIEYAAATVDGGNHITLPTASCSGAPGLVNVRLVAVSGTLESTAVVTEKIQLVENSVYQLQPPGAATIASVATSGSNMQVTVNLVASPYTFTPWGITRVMLYRRAPQSTTWALVAAPTLASGAATITISGALSGGLQWLRVDTVANGGGAGVGAGTCSGTIYTAVVGNITVPVVSGSVSVARG